MNLKLFLLSFSLIIFSNSSLNKVCRNTKGTEVDWYVIFFMPRSASSDNEIYYAYIDNTLTDLEYYKYEESTFPPTMITSYVTSATTSDFNYFLENFIVFSNNEKEKEDSSDSSFFCSSLSLRGTPSIFVLGSPLQEA